MVKGHPAQGLAETQLKYVMAYGQMGNVELALEHWEKCLELEPDWSAQRMIDIFHLWNFPEEQIAKFMEGVYKAGIEVPSN